MPWKTIVALSLALASSVLSAPVSNEGQGLSKRVAPETVYLSNCDVSKSILRSAMFYYPPGAESVHGERPEGGNHAGLTGNAVVTWEGSTISGVFGSGVVFTSQIAGGHHHALNHSGTGYTNTRNYNCFKDLDRLLFMAPNWGKCYSIYYCQ